MSVGGVVCLKTSFSSFLFLLPVKPCPKPLTFWVAMVILSPFMIRLGGFRRRKSPLHSGPHSGWVRLPWGGV